MEELEVPEEGWQETTDTQLDVDRALLHLTERQRLVFDLHYRKGCSHEEVAGVLGIPLGTVKTDILRGRETLKRILTRNGDQRDG